MIKVFKNFKKKDYLFMLTCVVLMITQVWLELRIPEYMSKVTRLVQTGNGDFLEIIIQGGFMLLCSLGSLVTAVIIGYFAALLSASLSLKLRSKIFNKVESFGMQEIKKFSTSSLITRTTNDVTQIEITVAMGLQVMIKAPIMAVWAISKILNKSMEWSALTGLGVIILLTTIALIMIKVIPKFEKVQKITDKGIQEMIQVKRVDEIDDRIGEFINREFTVFAEESGVVLNFDEFCFVAEDDDGQLLGAITGRAYYNEVHIGDLIIDDNYRVNDLGTKLVRAVEDAYRGKGYTKITLTTFGFQAPDFYKKLGYSLEFVREDPDPKLSKYFFCKDYL